MTTIGKYRHLSQCSTAAGHFNVLAIDHRANLRALLDRAAATPISDRDFVDFKLLVLRHLLGPSSAVLTDPGYGLGPGVANGVIEGRTGLISPIEVTDYTPHPSHRQTNFMPGWSVGRIKRMGGAGVKLLLYYHPDADNAAGQRQIVADIVAECARHDIPFFLEPVTYSLDPDAALDSDELWRVVVDMAATFSEMGVDVLKLQFPVDPSQNSNLSDWEKACMEVDAVCRVPWVLLSAGVDFETFLDQARTACEAGASGVMVGRAVWSEAVELNGEERRDFLMNIGRRRMDKLAEVCERYAAPWYERVDPPETMLPDWYSDYSE